MKDFRIALVQMNARLGLNGENLAAHEAYVTRAAEAGAQLVAFPEQSISGHWAEPGCNAAAEGIPDGPSTRRLIEWSRACGVFIAAGLSEADAGAVYNSYVIVGPDGFIGRQRKVHPSGDEGFYYRPGASFDVFDLPFCRVGVNVCADTNYPESARVSALKGAELLLAPHAARCGPAPADRDEQRRRVRARRQRAAKVGSVRAGDNGLFYADYNQVGLAGQVAGPSAFIGSADVVHAGGCYVFKPDGELLAESKADDFAEEMVLADLSAGDLAAARGRKCFSLTCRRPGAYGVIADTEI